MCRVLRKKRFYFSLLRFSLLSLLPCGVGLAINTRDNKGRLNGLYCHTASGAFYTPMARPPGGS